MNRLLATLIIAALAPVGAVAQTGVVADGKAVYDGPTQCKNCHGKAGEGGFGPDLAGRGLSVAEFSQAVRKPWGVMPQFTQSQVSDVELANMTAYFASLPKTAALGAWQVAVDPAMPHGQQVFVQTGCAQCHGAVFAIARVGLGAANPDFEEFKRLVYAHTDAYPKFEEELAAARTSAMGPAPAGPAAGNAAPPRLRMGNFVDSRVTEAELREIYDWTKDGIGYRPSLQVRFTPAAAGAPTYNLLLTNTGLPNKGVAAEGVVVDVSLPAGAAVASATGAGYKGVHKDATGADVAEWQISRVAAQQTVALAITLNAAPAGGAGLKGAIHWAKPGPKSGVNSEVMNFALAGPAARGG